MAYCIVSLWWDCEMNLKASTVPPRSHKRCYRATWSRLGATTGSLMGLSVSPVGLLIEFCVFLVGLHTGGAGVQLMKVFAAVLTLASVSSGNSVSSHSVEVRPFTLKPLRFLATM